MAVKLFVTGTDTNVGKTYISAGLLRALKKMGYATIGIKPVSSGGFWYQKQLYNQDALDLLEAASIRLDYQHINPFVFEPPIAPHLAATNIETPLSVHQLNMKLQHAFNFPCDIQLIEGAGGWMLPLNQHETMADFVHAYQMPVLLVIGIRLGCINHALLTYHAIKQKNLSVIGWVANGIEKDILALEGILSTLKHYLDAPYLGYVPFEEKPEHCLAIDKLCSNLS
jgi:dethiobiotin synthetase